MPRQNRVWSCRLRLEFTRSLAWCAGESMVMGWFRGHLSLTYHCQGAWMGLDRYMLYIDSTDTYFILKAEWHEHALKHANPRCRCNVTAAAIIGRTSPVMGHEEGIMPQADAKGISPDVGPAEMIHERRRGSTGMMPERTTHHTAMAACWKALVWRWCGRPMGEQPLFGRRVGNFAAVVHAPQGKGRAGRKERCGGPPIGAPPCRNGIREGFGVDCFGLEGVDCCAGVRGCGLVVALAGFLLFIVVV